MGERCTSTSTNIPPRSPDLHRMRRRLIEFYSEEIEQCSEIVRRYHFKTAASQPSHFRICAECQKAQKAAAAKAKAVPNRRQSACNRVAGN